MKIKWPLDLHMEVICEQQEGRLNHGENQMEKKK